MPDKKVSKSSASRPLTPSQKLDASLSDEGTVNMAQPAHDKARTALGDKFREREERWRREQSLHESQAEAESAAESASGEAAIEEAVGLAEGAEAVEPGPASKGGAS